MKSAIYRGWVRHRRYSPKQHKFHYRVFMMYTSLAELDRVLSMSPLWSASRFTPASFRRRDFHGDPRVDIREAVVGTVEESLGWRPRGDICVLANWRYFGFNMNPLTTYYCFDTDGDNVEAILAEVNNTPWNQRRAYVLDCKSDSRKQDIVFDKDFTVSPFNSLDMQYHWRSCTPGESLLIHIDTLQSGAKITDATLCLRRQPLSKARLNLVLLQYPMITLKVLVAIYWQALRLFFKGVPFLGKDKDSSQKLGAKSL